MNDMVYYREKTTHTEAKNTTAQSYKAVFNYCDTPTCIASRAHILQFMLTSVCIHYIYIYIYIYIVIELN